MEERATYAAGELGDIFSQADKLVQLKERKETLEKELEDVKAEFQQVNQFMVQDMINQELQNFNRSGKCFYVQNKVHATALADKKPELFKELRANGHGDLIQETVNAQTFQAFCKEFLEDADELPEWLKDKVNLYTESVVGIRKSGR